MSKFTKVTEIIPKDIPDWASNAIGNGDFFKVCVERVKLAEKLKPEIIWILEKCWEKLEIYFEATEGKYTGGQECQGLINKIDSLLMKMKENRHES